MSKLIKLRDPPEAIFINPAQITRIMQTESGSRVYFSSGEYMDIDRPPDDLLKTLGMELE